MPPFEPGNILPPKLHDAYSREREVRQRLADPNSQNPSETDNMVDSHVSVEQCQEESVPSTDERVGLPEPCSGPCSRITDDTGIMLPQHLDLKNSPMAAAVVEALANHIGIDLSPEAREAESRRGVAIIVHGAPCSGRTTQATAVGVVYGAPVLQLDTLLIEAISSASSTAGRKARELCIQAMVAKSAESSEPPQPPTTGKKQQPVIKEHSTDIATTIVPAVPFPVETHEDTDYAVHGGTLTPTHLPEDLIVEILTSRIQQEDCCKGLILDCIDSQFTNSQLVSLAVMLRAINNRRHIYFVHLSIELQVIKDRLEELEQLKMVQLREEEEKRREAEKEEELREEKLLNMDEDEYEELTEEQKEEVDAICLQRKRIKREERRRAKEERERLERERREEEERLKELEKSKKKGKKGQQKGGQPPKPQTMQALGGVGLSRPDSVASGINPQTSQVLGGFIATSSGVSVMSSMDSPNTAATPKHRIRRKGSAKTVVTQSLTESEDELSKLEKIYCNYKSGLEAVRVLLEDWDREKGVARPRKPTELDEQKPTPTRRSKAFKQKELEVMLTTAHDVEENREGLGIPYISVNACESVESITTQLLETELPSASDILTELGMGPDGAPIPRSFTFQVCPFPLKRRSHEEVSDVYSFIASSPDDP